MAKAIWIIQIEEVERRFYQFVADVRLMALDGESAASRLDFIIGKVEGIGYTIPAKHLAGPNALLAALVALRGQLQDHGENPATPEMIERLEAFAFTWGVQPTTVEEGKAEVQAEWNGVTRQRKAVDKTTTGRTVGILVRCTEAERSTIQAGAKAADMSLNSFCLNHLLRMAHESSRQVEEANS